MRNLLISLSTAGLLAVPSFAQARGFDSDFTAPVSGPIKLEIIVSEDLAHRANNLPKKLSDRSTGSRLNAAFANNGHYGNDALEYLVEDLQDEILEDFVNRNISHSETAGTLLRVSIDMAKPNRPTFNQLRRDTSLSFQSFGIGGADISAELIDAGGQVIGTADYSSYSTFSNNDFHPRGTWSDANRAFSRFSKQLSKKIASQSES